MLHLPLTAKVSRPSQKTANLDTPPATDFGYSPQGDLEHDSDIFLSNRGLADSISSLPPPGLPPSQKHQLGFGHVDLTRTMIGL